MAFPWREYSWRHNVDQVIRWTEAASILCSMEPDQYKAMLTRKAHRISDATVRASVAEFSAFYGDMLEVIMQGIERVNAMHATPKECVFAPVDLISYKSAWTKHVTGERQSLQELKSALDAIASVARKGVEIVGRETSGGYSSYSDYSETETDSDLEDDEEVEDDDADALKKKGR